MKRYRYQFIHFTIFLGLAVLLNAGCVAWVDRPPVPAVSVLEATGEFSTTLLVVRKKQFALSGVTFTIYVDGTPAVNLESGQYTRLMISAAEHVLQVSWDIGGLNIIGGGTGGGGYMRDPVQTYHKKISINCPVNATCFVLLEAKAFARAEEERLMITVADQLDGHIALKDMTFVAPGVTTPK